jgi:nucleotide-binding universal stress UspA family protein
MMTGRSGQDAGDGVGRVVAGVDGSVCALDAVRWAAAEAAVRGVPLVLVHALHLPEAAVAPFEPDDLAARQQEAGAALLASAAALAAAAHPELKIETGISPHNPAHGLLEFSTPDSLVVTGTRGHGGFVGMLLGSVSRAVAVHAEGPVAVVRGVHEPADGPVVLGVGSEEADAAAEFAFQAARRYGTGVRIVRAWWPIPPLGGMAMPDGVGPALATPGVIGTTQPQVTEEEERTWARQIVARASEAHPDVAVEFQVEAGNPVQVLCEAAADARLVVVGAHHRRLLSVGAGYVVEGLLTHCPAPVAVIPGAAPADAAEEAPQEAESASGSAPVTELVSEPVPETAAEA